MHAGTDEFLTASPLFMSLVENEDKTFQAALADGKIAKKKKTSFAYTDKTEDGDEVHVIVFHPDKKPLYAPKAGGIDDAGSFDHETGHILASDMRGRLGENLADSYAMLRHFQRFGDVSAEADYCGWRRAAHFVMTGVDTHLTTFSVDKILIDRKSADFISLTPKETLEIARAYARQNTPARKTLDKAARDFSLLCGRTFNGASCKKIAEITLQADPDSATFYLGARVLSALWQPGGREIDGKTIELKGAAWQSLRAKIEARMPPATKLACSKTP